MLLGEHTLRSWSKTQNTIAQSSAESELLATVKAASEALGMMSLGEDLGISFRTRIHIDATAAMGILERRGVGRVRHLDVGTLWLQEQSLRQAVEFIKVKGTANPADLMTKHLARAQVDQYLEALGYEVREGRAEAAVKLHPAKAPDPARRRATRTSALAWSITATSSTWMARRRTLETSSRPPWSATTWAWCARAV